jgi:hypothetical protein
LHDTQGMPLQCGNLRVFKIGEACNGIVLHQSARDLLVCPARYTKDRQLLCNLCIVSLDMAGIKVILIVSGIILINSDNSLAVGHEGGC